MPPPLPLCSSALECVEVRDFSPMTTIKPAITAVRTAVRHLPPAARKREIVQLLKKRKQQTPEMAYVQELETGSL